MRKRLLPILLLLQITTVASSQFNNEWIDYTKTYYRFYIAQTGMHRINQGTLATVGLGNTPLEHLQLWRNGQQVALHTSKPTGVPTTTDFIEFFATPNDGAIDRALYREQRHHLASHISLFTDSAAYFLTVNTNTAANLRIQTIPNEASGTSLTPATHVWVQARHDYKNTSSGLPRPYVNRGFAVNYGEYVYSSAYDDGEMLSSNDIFRNQNGQILDNTAARFANIRVFNGAGLSAKLKVTVAGSAPNFRNYRVQLNGNTVLERLLQGFEGRADSNMSVPTNWLNTSPAVVAVQNLSTNNFDRIVAGFVEIDYPSLPDAAGENRFSFYLPASATDTYIQLSNFTHGGVAPILYDITSRQRMQTVLAGDGKVLFVVKASSVTKQFFLFQPNTTTAQVSTLTPRNFVNYSQSANQGNYLIITNQRLLDGGASNNIELYRQYRSSAPGGAFNARIYTIDQLVDQFAFGVKMHPLSIKNFLRFARQRFSAAPRFCLLVGKGVTYDEFRALEDHPRADQLQLIPTFGYPASDNLLASNDLTASVATPIGRLNVVRQQEVGIYLDKVKEFEAAQASTVQTQEAKAWMKNVVHVVGANDAGTESLIRPMMENYRRTVSDTLFGGRVTTFNKFNATTGSTIEAELLPQLFEQGFSLMTYFGHSAATALDYNLDDPSKYNNPGKYPMFLLNGCNAGNFFTFDTARLQVINTISEKYVLAPNRGSIALLASTHFGIVSGLNVYSTGFYNSITKAGYNQPIGRNIQDAITFQYQVWGSNDYLARIHTEQQTLHGDPALRINAFNKPDYSIEQPNVVVNPSFISIAETNFKLKVYYYNLGQAINDSIQIAITRQYPASTIHPNGFTETIFNRRVKAPLAKDSLELQLPILPDRDKGINTINVALETENRIDELSETNNTTSAQVVIFEDELRPVYPYNFAIVNKPDIKLIASTSNPFSINSTYRMELDTTGTFATPLASRNITASGGIIEFDPGIALQNNKVYYWRLGVVPATGTPLRWNNFSFLYLQGTQTGFNQSHPVQHSQSGFDRINYNIFTRTWNFNQRLNNLFINHSIFGVSGFQDADFSIAVNNTIVSASACVGHSLIFNVFDPITFKPQRNWPGGAFGSGLNTCSNDGSRQYNFEWDDRDTANRRNIMRFMDAIPNGAYVVVRKFLDAPFENESFADILKSDEQYFGAGNSVYHRLKAAGFTELDSFKRPRTFIFVYKKNDASFAPITRMSESTLDKIQLNVNLATPDSLGFVTSPNFGPAKSWKEVKWRGEKAESGNGDVISVDVIGVRANGQETVLRTLNMNEQDVDISNISAAQYPFLKLKLKNYDSLFGTPYQLDWWRLYYEPVPEGAIAPNLTLTAKDSLYQGEPQEVRLAFKNISDTRFDSLRVLAFVTDRSNVNRPITLPKTKPLAPGDTAQIRFNLDTRNLPGINTLYIAFNPDNDQPEQYFFNNFLFKTFLVREDRTNPLLDVTFDGVRILNNDIVSSKPHIQIKLKDENNFLLLNDTAGLSISLRYPGQNNARTYRWGTDTLRLTPPTPGSNDNTATIDFTPVLDVDSENSDYELTVSGRDRSGNRAGNLDYRVAFKVFNKPMISNLLNYPNPFSTSTAFVFTITGFEVPQEFKIQILTVTGKIVREITKAELGPLRIGTNITEYKWDGTDMFGQKLANGVYLYRVVSSLNGSRMDQFRLNEGFNQNQLDVTDKFFNKGYGKMVILR